MNSIIRVIRTSTITDNDLYNGIDDDGDGEIDEEDEILAQVQDTSATVKVIKLDTGETIIFNYVEQADSTIIFDENDNASFVYYGGYKPVSANFQLENYAQYQLEVYSQRFDKTVTAITTVYPSVEYIDTLYTFQDSVVTMNVSDSKEIFWKSDTEVSTYYIKYEEGDQLQTNDWELVDNYFTIRDNDLTDAYSNVSVGRGFIFGVNYNTFLRFTVTSLNPDYGRYVISSLPLKDPNRTNLRDENGNPVMGSFGAIADKRLYVVIQ
jgi:hypothetical protein